MGTSESEDSFCTGLFGKTRQGVLTLLFGQAGSSFYTTQIMDAVKAGRGSVQRELRNLTKSGMIVREAHGRQIYYRANEKCPIFKELSDMIRKARAASSRESIVTGQTAPALVRQNRATYLPDKAARIEGRFHVPKAALAGFCRRNHIIKLSLFGSVLRDDFRPDSDIDVLVEFERDHFPSFFKMADIEDQLSALLGGRKVDLRTPGDLSRYFRQRVLEEAQMQYAATR